MSRRVHGTPKYPTVLRSLPVYLLAYRDDALALALALALDVVRPQKSHPLLKGSDGHNGQRRPSCPAMLGQRDPLWKRV